MNQMNVKAQFIVDTKGKKTASILCPQDIFAKG
jgi:hypothetical protein